MVDYEKDYNEFWKSIVENPDGTLNKEQIMKELHDFSLLIRNLSHVYCEITGNKASYPQIDPKVIIQLYEKQLEESYLEGYKDGKRDYEERYDG